MTVQFNLLPDVKVKYLKVKRQQHLVILGSVVASIAALIVFIMSLSVVYGVQKKNLSDLSKDIATNKKELQGTKDLTKVLTVQGQLKTLPDLHDKKVVSSKLFGYLSSVTPTDVTIDRLGADFAQSTLTVSGNAKDLATVNKFVDTLKFTTYNVQGQNVQKKAFSSVVLAGFTRDDKATSYNITFAFDPIVFSNTQSVDLSVPNTVTTRSEVDKPTALFQSKAGAQ